MGNASGGGRLRLLLATSSVVALLVGGGAPAAFAGSCYTGPFPFANNGAQTCIDAVNTSFSGGITNNVTGVITATGNAAPTRTGITVNGGSVGGAIINNGKIISGTSGFGIFVTDNATVSSGISNVGTISANSHGIFVGATVSAGTAVGISSFGGGISNSGTISADGHGIFVGGNASGTVNIAGTAGTLGTVTVSSFGGGISNSGTISAGGHGIFVGGVAKYAGSSNAVTTVNVASVSLSTFTGGISNSGIIVAGKNGIFVGGKAKGGIFPSGSSSAVFAGASVSLSNFSGGITNSGTIVAQSGHGIFVGGVAQSGGSVGIGNFSSGNIVNNGTIFAAGHGIFVGGLATSDASVTISTFSAGITNTGTIFAGGYGIFVGGVAHSLGSSANASVSVATFAGGISNSGTIAALGHGIIVGGTASGVNVHVMLSTFSNGISNTGTIFAGAYGIFVGGAAFGSDASVTISNFSGGISNNGTIKAGGHGIVVGGTASGGSSLTISTFSGGITNTGKIVAGGDGIAVGGLAVGGIAGASSSSVVVASSLSLSSFGGNVSNSGTIRARGTGILVGGFAGRAVSGTALPGNVTISNFSGGIFNSGTIFAGNNGIGVGGYATSNSSIMISTFGGGITNSGTISAGNVGILVGGSPGVSNVQISTFLGNVSNSGTIVAQTGIVIGSGVTFAPGGAVVNTGTIVGFGGNAINVSAATSPVTIDINAGAIIGNILGTTAISETINFALGSGTFTYAAPYGFSGFDQVNVNSGTVILDGTNSAISVAVNGGTLEIGDAANPGALLQANNVAVNNGGTLAGNGTIDPAPATTVTINAGGTLEPGTPGVSGGTLTIDGTLGFASGSFYSIDIAPGAGNNSKTAVNGQANLGGNGTVIVTPQLGHYSNAVYEMLVPTTLSGTFAGSTVNGDFTGSIALDYTTNPGDVDLDVSGASLVATPPGANINQQNVINGINNAILGSPANVPLPPQFLSLAGLAGSSFLNALTRLDGEDATGAQTSAFELMSEFLNLLLDPSSGGSDGGGGGGGGALGFAPEQLALPPDIAEAYATVLKAPPPVAFAQRWTAWGSAFGGSGITDGNTTIGSNNVTASDYGFAGGMDYHVDPATLYGFALAGGGTNWNLAQGLGDGRSDAFQGGVYGKHYLGPVYVSGALAFANHWFTTDRIAMGDQLTAKFEGQSYAARFETGYRYGLPAPAEGVIAGITPYAALQTQWFHTPTYSETDLTGGGLGLTYNAMNANDTRSELGARFDDLTTFDNVPLILRGRLAWAHDWVSNPALDAAFQVLPGSSFVVNGATPPPNSALTTLGAELRITAHWSALAKFDGDFAPSSQTYAGTGTLRYTW